MPLNSSKIHEQLATRDKKGDLSICCIVKVFFYNRLFSQTQKSKGHKSSQDQVQGACSGMFPFARIGIYTQHLNFGNVQLALPKKMYRFSSMVDDHVSEKRGLGPTCFVSRLNFCWALLRL